MKRWLCILLVSVLCTGALYLPAAAEEQETNLFTDETDMIRSVQEKLSELGYYQGEIDGEFGEDTVSALSEYQADNGLAVTGTVSDPTLELMFGVTLEAEAASGTQEGTEAEPETAPEAGDEAGAEAETEYTSEYERNFVKNLGDHKVYLLFDKDTKTAVRFSNKDVYVQHGTYKGKFKNGVTITWEDGYQETFTYKKRDKKGTLTDRYGVEVKYKTCTPERAERVLNKQPEDSKATGFKVALNDYSDAAYGTYAWDAVTKVGESVYSYGITYNLMGSSRAYAGDGIWQITAAAVVTEKDGSTRTVQLESLVNLIQDKVTNFSENYN